MTGRSKFCWNVNCPTPGGSRIFWKQGWRMEHNLYADLCQYCGSIFEESRFCEVFHCEQTGWRNCTTCDKRIHCGCICSAANFVLLGVGGVECSCCSKSNGASASKPDMEPEKSDHDAVSRKRKADDGNTTQGQVATTVDVEDEPPSAEFNFTTTTTTTTVAAPDGKVTIQPCKQLAPDGRSTLVPLFEKMLTASDASRIGRLVLPKACAESFFPPISSSEGIAIIMPDVNGKEWKLQFRFWPNNSSRMYVLEGIFNCVKEMQLVAGDVVTFSRQEPGGQLVMGYRRHSSSPRLKKAADNGSLTTSSSLTKSGGGRHKQGGKSEEVFAQNNGGGSSSRARTTWEEAQELLTPPPGVTPSIMTIDGHRFEEYEEPPILSRKKLAVYASPLHG